MVPSPTANADGNDGAASARGGRDRFFPFALAAVVLIVALLVTAMVWLNARRAVYHDLQNEFDYRVREAVDRLDQRMAVYQEVLRSTQGFLGGRIDVDPRDFRDYVANLALEQHFPGIQGLAVAKLFPADELGRHVAAMRRAGYRHYAVHPGGARERYSAITRIEPFTAMNRRAFGFDMLTEPRRRDAMLASGDSGRAIMSAMLNLIQESGEAVQSGFVMYLPVYQRDMPLETVAQRRAALRGWVGAPFRMNDLMAGLYGERSGDLHIRIYDSTQMDPAQLLYDSRPETGGVPLYRALRRIAVAGRLWTIAIDSGPGFEAGLNRSRLTSIAFSGITLALLLATLVWMLASARRRALAVAMDMTRKLRASEFRWKYALEGAGEGVWDFNLDSGHVLYSSRWKEMLGYTGDDVTPDRAAWEKRIHPDDLARTMHALEECIAGHTNQFAEEFRMCCRDGTWKWVLSRGMVVNRTADGVARRMIGTQSDITQRKQAEEREAQRIDALDKARVALAHAQRLESVGKLTGGVAHDFNNTLQVISGNLQLLQTTGNADPQAERLLSSAMAAVDRGARLSSQLLAFARRQPLQPAVVNLNRLLDSMEELLQRALGDGVRIVRESPPDLWNILIDPARLENVILNLALNARDAMNGRGILTLRLCNVEPTDMPGAFAAEAPERAGDKARQGVLMSMSDTGSGMTRDVLEQAFEPFFTTKEEGRGTGLGLSMAHGFVIQSGGKISIDSTPGKGTTVSVHFLRSTEPEAALVPPEDAVLSPVETLNAADATVLVVEDNASVREMVVNALSSLGYRILQAGDAQSALAILERGEPVDLLFTDVVMPGPLASRELARRAREIDPSIAVLFTSGYARNAITRDGRLEPDVNLLSKPYRIQELAATIAALLAQRAQRLAQYPDLRDGARLRAAGTPHDAGAASDALREASHPATPYAGTGRAASGGRILLADDNTDLRTLMCDMLEMQGWKPSAAADGRAALELLRGQPFDVLFTDLALPGIDGAALARQAKALQPGIRLLLAGVSPAPSAAPHAAPASAVLHKPYTFSELLQALRAA